MGWGNGMGVWGAWVGGRDGGMGGGVWDLFLFCVYHQTSKLEINTRKLVPFLFKEILNDVRLNFRVVSINLYR
jgi:hypothetical protein